MARNLARRGYTLDVTALKALEEKRKPWQVEVDRLRAEPNPNAKAVGAAKGGGEDVSALIARGESLIAVPAGQAESPTLEVRRWGEPRDFAFPPRDHVEVGERLAGLDLEAAARISGARFVVMRAQVARLHRALAQFMLDLHTREHGYTEVHVP